MKGNREKKGESVKPAKCPFEVKVVKGFSQQKFPPLSRLQAAFSFPSDFLRSLFWGGIGKNDTNLPQPRFVFVNYNKTE